MPQGIELRRECCKTANLYNIAITTFELEYLAQLDSLSVFPTTDIMDNLTG